MRIIKVKSNICFGNLIFLNFFWQFRLLLNFLLSLKKEKKKIKIVNKKSHKNYINKILIFGGKLKNMTVKEIEHSFFLSIRSLL